MILIIPESLVEIETKMRESLRMDGHLVNFTYISINLIIPKVFVYISLFLRLFIICSIPNKNKTEL